MYLPPDKNAIASSGFGGRADASNNFDGNNNNNNGYGAIVPNAYRTKDGPWTENGDYDLSTKTTNGLNGVQTAGPYGMTASGGGSPSDQRATTNYDASPSGLNDYGRVSVEYGGGRSTSGTGGDCGGSTGAFSDGGGGYSGAYNDAGPTNLDGRNRPGKGASQTDGTSPPDDDSRSELRASDNYGQSASRLLGDGGNNHGQTSTNNGYHRGGLSNPTATDGFGHGQPPPEPGLPPTSNGYGRVESQIPSSGRGDYGQSNPSANGGGPYGQSASSTDRNGYTRADTGRKGDFGSAATGNGATSSGRQSSSSGHGQGGTCGPPGGEDTVQGGPPSTGSPADPGHGIRNQNKHSTLVPKDQYQNSNLPDAGFERQAKGSYGSTTNANGDEPGSNAFSNFAPGNRPNQPPTNVGSGKSYDSTTNNDGDYGEPGFNAFSNFAPGNRPNRPPQPIGPSNSNCDRSSNNFNDASTLTEAVFPSSNAGY